MSVSFSQNHHLLLPHFVNHKANLIHYILKGCLYLFFPISGWIADTWFGRYKIINTGLCISLFGAILNIMVLPISYLLPTGTTKEVLMVVQLLPLYVGYCSFSANIIQFATDQMIEISASGEQLSALIHWQYWASSVGEFIEAALVFMHIQEVPLSIATVVISLTCLLSIVLSQCLFSKWLTTTPMKANTLRNVYSILNYARKTKYPRKRSALTYLDEEHPSRLDYGKDKFGGPFTEEEVEDVKTILRMIPLFVCMLGGGISGHKWSIFASHLQPSNDIAFLGTFLPLWIMIILIPPLYQLVLYPLFYNKIPTMLQRTGLGLMLSTITLSSYLVMDTIGHVMNPKSGCMMDSSSKIPVSSEWLYIPVIVNGIAIAMHTGDVFSRVCDCPNTCKDEGFDGRYMVCIQRHGKLLESSSSFCFSLPT